MKRGLEDGQAGATKLARVGAAGDAKVGREHEVVDIEGNKARVAARLSELYAAGELVPGDLDTRIISDLESLPGDGAMVCLNNLIATDRTRIVNKSGFLKGIISKWKVRRETERRCGYCIDPIIQARLDDLLATGQIVPGDIDQAIMDSLAGFPPDVGMQIIDAFTAKDLTSISNKSGFLAGIMKRFRNLHFGTGPNSRGAIMAAGGYDYGPPAAKPAAPGPDPKALQGILQSSGINPATAKALAAMLPAANILANQNDPYAGGGDPYAGGGGYNDPYAYNSRGGYSSGSNPHRPPPGGHPPANYQIANFHPSVWQKLETFFIAGLIERTELDPRILDSLASLPPQQGEEVLDKLAENDLSTIMNKNGFLAGIMRRVRSKDQAGPVGMRGPRGPPPNFQSTGAGVVLSPTVQHRLEIIYAAGYAARGELDEHVLTELSELDEKSAIDALQRFQAADLSNVMSKSGFLVGIIRRSKKARAGQLQMGLGGPYMGY